MKTLAMQPQEGLLVWRQIRSSVAEEKMKRTAVTVVFLVFLSAIVVTITILPEARATTRYVGGAGPGNYTTIQAAIDDADPGDTLYVYGGTYYEHVLVGKTLSLVGEDRNSTTIDGSGGGILLNVSADSVNMTGLALANAGTAILLRSVERARITNNSFWDNDYGIYLDSSNDNLIASNNLSDNLEAVTLLDSPSNTINHNNISFNTRSGIWVTSSIGTTISNNTVWDSGDGITVLSGNNTLTVDNNVSYNVGHGLMVNNAGNNTVRNNTISHNGYYGIYLWNASNNTVSHNKALGNQFADIYLNYSHNNTVDGNNASEGDYGVYLQGSHDNKVVDTLGHWNAYAGIELFLSDRNEILNNTLWENKQGIVLFRSGNNTVDSNDVLDNADLAIVLDYSNDCVMSNNTVFQNGGGIHIADSDGNVIRENNVSYNDNWGMHIVFSENTLFADNIVKSNGNDGIGITYSKTAEVINTTAISNDWFGISLAYTSDIIISGSRMVGDGIGISGNAVAHWATHSIDTTNTVNGRPVRYWKNIVGGTVPPDAGQVILGNCVDVVVENQNISNADTSIILGVSSGSYVANNTLSDNSLYGIGLEYSVGNTIENNTAKGHRHGIHLFSGDGNTISDNNASGNNYNGIILYHSDGNTIRNNTASWNNLGIDLHYSTGNTLFDNKMIEDGVYIWGDSLEHWNTHSIGTSNVVNGKPVQYWKNATGGVVPSGAGEVILANATGVVVSNQNVSDGSVGILMGFSSGNSITGNLTSSSGLGGLLLYRSHNNTIGYGNVSLNDWGVSLVSSVGNSVTNNVVMGNERGIRLWGHSDNNTINTNNVSNNKYYGISLTDSDGNTIVGNDVAYNYDSIALYYSSNNRVFHNNIIENTGPAFDNTDTNQWDDGYPSGGNYWSDYKGSDDYSGPNQDQPGSDGIGDSPYYIDIDRLDRYPLMFPFEVPAARPPTVLDAILSGNAQENVTIHWSLSPDDGAGLNSIVNYDVYRSTAYDRTGSGYQLIASLPNGTSVFIDRYAGEGGPDNYFYLICAVDANNSIACAEDQAGKFTRPLVEGPNLVSVPLIQSNTSVERVLQTVRFDKAWAYRAYDPNDQWKWFMTFKSYGDLWRINHTIGVWINVTTECNFTVAGIVPPQSTVHLYEGWNLVSFPSFNATYSVADLKAETAATRVEGYDPTPPHFLRVLGDAEVLVAGIGYWVKVEADTVWTVEVS